MLIYLNLIFIFSVSFCTLRTKRNIIQPLPAYKEEYSTDEIIEIMFPALLIKEYHPGYLPDEIWIQITKTLDLVDLFNLSVANKDIGAMIRRNYLFQSYLSSQSDRDTVLLEFLYATDFNIHQYHRSLIAAEKMKRMQIYKVDLAVNPGNRHLDYYRTISGKLIVLRLLEKSQDFRIISKIFQSLIKFPQKITLPPAIADYLYGDLKDGGKAGDDAAYYELHYLPPLGSPKLFQVFCIPDIAKIMVLAHSNYSEMFNACIIADYIIPLWKGEEVRLTDYELRTLKELLPYMINTFRIYFTDLFWACFFITGTMRKTEKNVIGPLCRFLESLGFTWETLVTKKTYNQANSVAQLSYLHNIYRAALLWGLDINKLAQNTQTDETSKEILAGRIPDHLVEGSVVKAENCLMHSNHGMKKIIMVEGEVFPEGSENLEATLKRKMEEHGFLERPTKRHRGDLLAVPENTRLFWDYIDQVPSVGQFEGPPDQPTVLSTSLNIFVLPPKYEKAVDSRSSKILLLSSLLAARGNIQAQINNISQELGIDPSLL